MSCEGGYGAGTHREGEVGVVLEEDGDGLAEVEELECADVVPVQQDLPLFGVVQPHDELEDCALPRAVRPYNHLGERL